MWTVNKYPDGSKYVEVSSFEEAFTYRIESYEDLWLLRQLRDIYAYNNLNATVYIPWFFEGQADRRFASNMPDSLKLVCKFINDMQWKAVYVLHPHNSSVLESLINNVVIISNSGFIKQVLALNSSNKDNTILMSTDAGGFKPLMQLASELRWEGETYSASKARVLNSLGLPEIVQQVDREDFNGKDILLVDDICVKGGTFIGLAEKLKTRNVGKLFLAVTHMTVANPSPKLFEVFDRVFTTNSTSYPEKSNITPDSLRIFSI